MKKNVPYAGYIGPAFKLALVLAFLPFISLIITLLAHWPLPTFVINFLTGERATYYLFMENDSHNVLGSVAFAISCFFIGLWLIARLVHERGSLKLATHDLIRNFFHDLFDLNAPPSKPKTASAAPPNDEDTKYRTLREALVKPRSSVGVPETSP